MKITIYDPPSGWRYGFPREYKPQDPDEPIGDTLRRDGYPEEEIAVWGDENSIPCRFWEYEEKIKPQDID